MKRVPMMGPANSNAGGLSHLGPRELQDHFVRERAAPADQTIRGRVMNPGMIPTFDCPGR